MPTATDPTVPPAAVLELAFNKPPCERGRIDAILDYVSTFARHADRYLEPDVARDIEALSADPDMLHRQLLALRRKLGPGRQADRVIREALDMVRSHSTLYTPRACWCVESAWRQFTRDAPGQVWALVEAGWWAVAEGSRLYPDLLVDLADHPELGGLTRCVGVDKYTPVGQIPDRLVIRVLGPDHIEVSRFDRKKVRTGTLHRPSGVLRDVANLLRADAFGSGWRHTAAGRVIAWPRQAAPIIAGRYQACAQTRVDSAERAAWIAALLEADLEDLTVDQVTVAVKLAPSWPSTPAQLVLVARGVTAPVR